MTEAMAALRSYVTANDGHEYDTLGDGLVCLTVTHNYLKQRHMDIRFNLHDKVREVKAKIYRHCGTPPEWMSLVLKTSDGEVICELSDEEAPLGFYSPTSGMVLKVVDTNPHSLAKGGGLEDVSLVKKYRMSEEDYDKRKGTIRDWKREQLAKDPNFVFPGSKPKLQATAPATEADCTHLSLQSRCEVYPGDKRGTIVFIGETDFAAGYWVGVILDEPTGRNNGTVKGRTYFECDSNYGIFCKPQNVKAGDFPERGLSELEDSDEEEGCGDGCCQSDDEL